jgi:hypothetical protein
MPLNEGLPLSQHRVHDIAIHLLQLGAREAALRFNAEQDEARFC